MTEPIRTPRASAVATTWPDQWLADAAVRRSLSGAAHLADFGDRPTAWAALLAAGATDDAVLELACLVSATKAVDLSVTGPAGASLMLASVSEKLGVVAVRKDGPTIVVATSNPLGSTLERDLHAATGLRVAIVTASPQAIHEARARIYGVGSSAPTNASDTIPATQPNNVATPPPAPSFQPARKSVVIPGLAPRDAADDPEGGKSHVIKFVDEILSEALRADASDLHFEPKEDGLLVRFRVDGGLYDARRMPADQSSPIIRRLKIVANLDIADSMRPQDGRATITHEGRKIDLRVSTLPLGAHVEKVVVRVLDSKVAARELGVIGYTAKELTRVKRLLELPEGLILVTGPTGSGKTSTLYAAVRHVHRTDINIVTVEDPIEYRIDGINQVQVNEKTRMTFAASLRSILRQDPDVVLIGEMRDAETASIAVKASMTGHLVLSTLHASDALSTLDRLFGMDIDAGALAAALKGIIGQRLVRKLCEHCASSVSLADLPVHQQQLLMGRHTQKLRKPVGCAECRGTGYRGRTIVAEIFLVTPVIQRAIARRADIGELSDLAKQCGTLTMWESGLERVLDGTTSLYELLDNVAAPLTDTQDESIQTDVDALLAQLLAKPSDHPPAPRAQLPRMDDISPPLDPGADDVVDRALAIGSSRDLGDSKIGTPASTVSRGRAGPLKILVVNDDRAARRVLAEALSREGLGVIEAADGEAALSYARRLRPDVIITDVAMPKLDAVGLLQGLTGEKILARVIVYTSQRDSDLHRWLAELGAEDVVSHAIEAKTLAIRLRGKVVSVA
ncbi:MAG: type II/IV secretion system protein [bacterium]